MKKVFGLLGALSLALMPSQAEALNVRRYVTSSPTQVAYIIEVTVTLKNQDTGAEVKIPYVVNCVGGDIYYTDANTRERGIVPRQRVTNAYENWDDEKHIYQQCNTYRWESMDFRR